MRWKVNILFEIDFYEKHIIKIIQCLVDTDYIFILFRACVYSLQHGMYRKIVQGN